MKLAIMQPTFNPWIGYFDLIDYVDQFVFLDIVQLNQQSWQTRNKIKIKNNELMFSLPIQKTKLKDELLIKDTLLDFRKFDFRKKLLKTLEQNYKKSKYFISIHPIIADIVMYETPYLSNYNINIIKTIIEKLNISTKTTVVSQTSYEPALSKGELVLDICKYFGSNDYISPLGSKDYLENTSSSFRDSKVNITYQYYKHSTYTQLGDDFIPYIGIFDLLYNEGIENSLNIIRRGRTYENR